MGICTISNHYRVSAPTMNIHSQFEPDSCCHLQPLLDFLHSFKRLSCCLLKNPKDMGSRLLTLLQEDFDRGQRIHPRIKRSAQLEGVQRFPAPSKLIHADCPSLTLQTTSLPTRNGQTETKKTPENTHRYKVICAR